MGYCIKCGKQTDNADHICDDCAKLQAGTVEDTAAEQAEAVPQDALQDAQGETRASDAFGSAQGGQGANAQSAGGQGYNAYGAPYPPYGAASGSIYPIDRSGFPMNKCGLIGFIFSVASFFCFVAIFFSVFSFIGQHAEWFENPNFQPTMDELMELVSAVLVPMLFSFVFAVTGVVLSAVGLARYRRFRAVGFPIAGLVIGALILLFFIGSVGLS